MDGWVKKDGYETCIKATEDNLNVAGTEIYHIRFIEGKFSHYHNNTTEYFYFTAGTGRVILGDEEHKLYPGASILIPPTTRHTFINDSATQVLEAILVKTNVKYPDTYRI